MATQDDTDRATRRRSLHTDSRTYARVGTKGQFVIPAAMRDELGLQLGQKLRLEIDRGRLVVTPVPTDLISRLRGSLAGPGPSMLEELMREHREEIERDEAEVARWRERHGQDSAEKATVTAGEGRSDK